MTDMETVSTITDDQLAALYERARAAEDTATELSIELAEALWMLLQLAQEVPSA